MTMLRRFLLFLFLLVPLGLIAQEKPQYTQYIFNNYLLNPAMSGMENYLDVKIGRRLQWAGMNNAPTTTFITANWNLNGDYLWDNPLSLPHGDEDPMSKSYTQYYTSSPAHHGMGVMAVSDKAGALSSLDVGLTYAYHLQLSSNYNLSVGVYGGLSKFHLDAAILSLENNNDPALSNLNATQYKPDLAIGTWLYGARFFAGLAIQQVLPQQLSFTHNIGYSGSKSTPLFFATTGYKFYMDEFIAVLPSIMFRKGIDRPYYFDLNTKVSYKDKFWLGASYRKSDSFAAFLGFNLKNFANLTYAYDFTVSDLRGITGGTHEIVLGFQLGGK